MVASAADTTTQGFECAPPPLRWAHPRPAQAFKNRVSPPRGPLAQDSRMDAHTSSRPRKRRAINACANCRTSKVRCDGNRPCQRCDRNDVACQYFDAVKDENVLRIERLEAEMAALRQQLSTRQMPCRKTSVSNMSWLAVVLHAVSQVCHPSCTAAMDGCKRAPNPRGATLRGNR